MSAETTVQVKELTADNLKAELWQTLQDLRAGNIQPRQGDAIASQAREIIRIVKVQLQVSQQSKSPVQANLIEFTGK